MHKDKWFSVYRSPLNLSCVCVESVACTIKKYRCHVSLKQVGEMKTKPKNTQQLAIVIDDVFSFFVSSQIQIEMQQR